LAVKSAPTVTTTVSAVEYKVVADINLKATLPVTEEHVQTLDVWKYFQYINFLTTKALACD
jgi:hypothetical protein